MATLTQDLYRYSHTIGFYAQNGRGFNNPVDVARGRDGVLYVLNRAGSEVELRMLYKRVTMCTLDEDYLGEFSSGGDRGRPADVAGGDRHRCRRKRLHLR